MLSNMESQRCICYGGAAGGIDLYEIASLQEIKCWMIQYNQNCSCWEEQDSIGHNDPYGKLLAFAVPYCYGYLFHFAVVMLDNAIDGGREHVVWFWFQCSREEENGHRTPVHIGIWLSARILYWPSPCEETTRSEIISPYENQHGYYNNKSRYKQVPEQNLACSVELEYGDSNQRGLWTGR